MIEASRNSTLATSQVVRRSVATLFTGGTFQARRDRIGVVHRRPVGDGDAGRAAARAVQGRGEGARPRAGPAARPGEPPSVPRPVRPARRTSGTRRLLFD